MDLFLLIIIFLIYIRYAQGISLPKTFKKCNRKSPELNECMRKSVQDGISQLTKPFKAIGLPNMEPLKIPAMTIGAGSGPVNLQQHYKNVELHGMTSSQVARAELDLGKKTMVVEIHLPKIRFEAEYKIDGSILLLPVTGDGHSTFILNDIVLDAILTFKEVAKNGKIYYNFLTSDVNFEANAGSFNFQNLFNGDKQLGDNINNLLNQEWKTVVADMKGGYQEVFSQVLKTNINNVFSRVPVADIFDD